MEERRLAVLRLVQMSIGNIVEEEWEEWDEEEEWEEE